MKFLFTKRVWAHSSIAFLALGMFLYFFGEILERGPAESPLSRLDHELIDLIVALRSTSLNKFFLELTALGSLTVLTTISLTILLLLSTQKRWRDFSQLLFASAASAAATELLKALVARDRPPLSGRLDLVQGFSFPSGHSSASTAIYLTLVLLAIPGIRARRWQLFALSYAIALALLISFSRVYLGVHFASDAIAGFCLGLGIACVAELLLNFRANKH